MFGFKPHHTPTENLAADLAALHSLLSVRVGPSKPAAADARGPAAPRFPHVPPAALSLSLLPSASGPGGVGRARRKIVGAFVLPSLVIQQRAAAITTLPALRHGAVGRLATFAAPRRALHRARQPVRPSAP
eukprot:360044-Chlamydomonas_euryale.AAC.2